MLTAAGSSDLVVAAAFRLRRLMGIGRLERWFSGSASRKREAGWSVMTLGGRAGRLFGRQHLVRRGPGGVWLTCGRYDWWRGDLIGSWDRFDPVYHSYCGRSPSEGWPLPAAFQLALNDVAQGWNPDGPDD